MPKRSRTPPRPASAPAKPQGRLGRPGIVHTSPAFLKFESYGMLETAASVGWKVKDAIVWFRLALRKRGKRKLSMSDPSADISRPNFLSCMPLTSYTKELLRRDTSKLPLCFDKIFEQ
jgi:hypothetical protein